jgi:hypothetical protein
LADINGTNAKPDISEFSFQLSRTQRSLTAKPSAEQAMPRYATGAHSPNRQAAGPKSFRFSPSHSWPTGRCASRSCARYWPLVGVTPERGPSWGHVHNICCPPSVLMV